MEKYYRQKYREEGYRLPPYGYPPINEGRDIPPIEEETPPRKTYYS